MALASVVFYGAGKTHIYSVYFLFYLTIMRVLGRLRVGGLLFGGRVSALPGRHRLGLLRRRRAARAARTSLLQVWGVGTRSQDARHFHRSFLRFRPIHQVVTALARSGWAALGLGCALVAQRVHHCCRSPVGELARHTHTIKSLSHVCLAMHCYEGCVFSPFHGCLVLYFARHACSFWFWIVVLVRVYFACKSCGTRFDCVNLSFPSLLGHHSVCLSVCF